MLRQVSFDESAKLCRQGEFREKIPFSTAQGQRHTVLSSSNRGRLRGLTPAVHWVFALLMGFAFLVTGCGYSTKRPFPTDIHTVHVEIFQSREFRRELEFRLTEALAKRIEMDTPYRIADQKSADAELSGEIVNVENRTLGSDLNTDLPREIGSTVLVRFRFKDLRTGKTLVDRPRFVYQTSYIPPAGETFTQGMARAMDGLAESIVEALESPW